MFASSLAEAATHTSSDYTETATRVIMTRDAEIIGEYGETAGRIDVVGTLNSSIDTKVGDTITIDDGINAGTWRLHRKIDDDGYTRRFEVVNDG